MEKRAVVELKRDLGPWAAASIVVGTVIGSGIFLVPKTMIQNVGTVEAVFAVWVVGGLLSLAGAPRYGGWLPRSPWPAANMPSCGRRTDRCGGSSIVGPRCWWRKAGRSRRWPPGFFSI